MYLYADERDSGTYWRIRESYYEDEKPKTRNVEYLGTVENILALKRNHIQEGVELNSLSFGPEAALRWAFEDLGLDTYFTELLDPVEAHEFPAWQKMFVAVWRRWFQRLSIRKAVLRYNDQIFPYWWREKIPTEQRFYQFLGEALDEQTIETAQQELAGRLLDDRSLDTCHLDTTNYVTYAQDDTSYLRVGKSKDNVVGRRIVGLALVTSDDGMPVLGEAYPGNRNDTKLFPELFEGVCDRLVNVGGDLENMTVVFDRGFDDKDNFDLAGAGDAHVVAAVRRSRTAVLDKLDDADLESFKQAYETSYGTCYVAAAGQIEIGAYDWELVLSYHDSTREKVREEMDDKRQDAEEILAEQRQRLEGGQPGRPPTENSIREKLKAVLKKDLHRLDWTFDEERKDLSWEWGEAWERKYRFAGIQPIVTDHDDWTPGRIAKTYFDRNDLEDMFHLTKEAMIVPVEPPYVKEDHLIRAHLFLVFVGLVCYQHVRGQFPAEMTDEQIKEGLERLHVVVSTEDGTDVQFRLANLDRVTEQLVVGLNLREFLPS